MAEKKQVLFVDDEPMVLDALKNVLRSVRHAWNMTFVTSGALALEQLRSRPFDVIVSDMRMPVMDGATLLLQVQKEFPEVVRIILSGHAELETAIKSVAIAHQYLTKPCDSELLRSVVERACGLKQLLADEQLRHTMGQITNLPSMSAAYTQLSQALTNPRITIAEVSRIVEKDVAMCVKILQLVNSAFLGVGRRITNIREAINYIGTDMLSNIALSVEAFRVFRPNQAARGFDPEALQRHSILAARIAGRLVSEKRATQDAFMSAMLHDVGQLILATHRPKPFSALIENARQQKRTLYQVEKEEGGITHAELGAYLLGLWGLPYSVVEAVAHHHAPNRVPHSGFDVMDAVYVASCLAHEACAAIETTSSPGAHDELDLDYLSGQGVLSNLDDWRAIAAEEAARAEDAV